MGAKQIVPMLSGENLEFDFQLKINSSIGHPEGKHAPVTKKALLLLKLVWSLPLLTEILPVSKLLSFTPKVSYPQFQTFGYSMKK